MGLWDGRITEELPGIVDTPAALNGCRWVRLRRALRAIVLLLMKLRIVLPERTRQPGIACGEPAWDRHALHSEGTTA